MDIIGPNKMALIKNIGMWHKAYKVCPFKKKTKKTRHVIFFPFQPIENQLKNSFLIIFSLKTP